MLTVTSPPLKGAGGMFITVTSPPLKEVRELAQRSMCKGGMFIIASSANRQINSSTHHLIPHQLLNRNFLRDRVSRLHTITTDKVNARSFHQLIPR